MKKSTGTGRKKAESEVHAALFLHTWAEECAQADFTTAE
jgi:hypothetical protein